MNTAINIINITLLIGLIIFIYLVLIKKLSNNYKVLILPFITLINSIIFGYKSYKTSDNIELIISIVIFFTSILLIGLIFIKINMDKKKPLQDTINNTEINHNHLKKIKSIELKNKNYDQTEVINLLEYKNIISKNVNNIEFFNAILNLEKINNKIEWIDKSPTNSNLNNLKTLIYFLQKNYNLNGIDSTVVYKSIFLPYFNLNRKVSEKSFSQTYSIVLQEIDLDQNSSYKKISKILKVD